MVEVCGLGHGFSTRVSGAGAPYTAADRHNPGLIALTDSASTPRLRATFAIYLVLIAATVFVGPRAIQPWLYYTMGIVGFICVALACLGRIWCSVFIAGHYYKIVPFLIWYHRFGPLVGTRKVPKVADLYSERIANGGALLLAGGFLGLAAGAFLGSAAIARGAAVALTAGVLVEVIVIAGIARRRPT